jgi:hypothetical protein
MIDTLPAAVIDAGHPLGGETQVLQVEVPVLVPSHEQALLRKVIHQFRPPHEPRFEPCSQIVPTHVLEHGHMDLSERVLHR